MKKTILSIVAAAVLLGGFFVAYDVDEKRAEARAEVEAERATTEYQQAYARQLARCGW